ncbi:prepilin-type N-terminal cleavage/methylation domain-containing protein [Lysobacter soyae]|uniref:Prepilin-type N-terminal cleavage/methylation domain-containing protein n=1 Tax=Lysobacter soyae TaxID=2764185 RepID=A0ABX8WN56_9GAMM|nr:PilW family protein [Lysobacter sp. CJ11]QYR52535.1 prepilin-type N-terminal cleavage/methylation domain-containing protein [Lysobacter sp. CJ11]
MSRSNFQTHGQEGFTLVELMISLVLGLLVIAAAGGIFLSNKRVYGSTEAINRIQENQRAAFELMSRDLREAGANPCTRFNATVGPVNLLADRSSPVWSRFQMGLTGTEGGTSDNVVVYNAGGRSRVTAHATPGADLTVSDTAGLVNGQTLMVCNADTAMIFSATKITSGGTIVGHDGAGNCGRGFTRQPDYARCADAVASNVGYCFNSIDQATCGASAERGRSPAMLIVPAAIQWSIANNGRGGTSLFRTVNGTASEIAEGVTSLQLSYKIGNSTAFVDASAVGAAQWATVTAVRVGMNFVAAQGAQSTTDIRGTNNAALTRTAVDVIALRNHLDIQ